MTKNTACRRRGTIAPRLMPSPASLTLTLSLSLTTASVLASTPECYVTSPDENPIQVATGDPVIYAGRAEEVDRPLDKAWTFEGGSPPDWSDPNRRSRSSNPPAVTYAAPGTYIASFSLRDKDNKTCGASRTVVVTQDTVGPPPGGGGDGDPVARGDTYATPVGKTLEVDASRVSGVLYNDFDTDADGNSVADSSSSLTAVLVSDPSNGSVALNPDGSFRYTPNNSLGDNDNDSFTYQAQDADGNLSAETTVNINILSDQPDFKIMMNYELGMHCTGFEFAYCCVLPPYNSILAQVVKPEFSTESGSESSNRSFPRLLEGDPKNGLDGLGRETVVRDFDNSGNFQKYYLEYFHDAQPRREGQGKPQAPGSVPAGYLGHEETLISAVEGNSLFYFQTIYDSAAPDPVTNALVYGSYEGADDVVQGSGVIGDVATDNYANGWLNHFYIYVDAENPTPIGPNFEGHGVTGLEADKIRLGVAGQIEYPADVGAALQPMGPTGAASGFDNVLTFSGDTGTVVYTQMKVLEDLPVMLTSPRIWETLGLPLTPLEDSIAFFGDPGLIDEDSIRPYVAMKARLHEANCDAQGNCIKGSAVIGSNGQPVIGFGTAPIDIPNCERCHSVPATDGQGNPNVNSPAFIRQDFAFPHGGTFAGASLDAITDAEYQFWNAYYNIVPGVDSDWYSRLKGAAINMLALHDFDQGTGFTSAWPANSDTNPATNPVAQNTRLGKESVICQKCHADNVIAVVKSATKNGAVIKPITEAIHWRHRETSEGGSIDFADATGRSGGCQGCHPAHRSDGVMDGYPITLGGDNEQAEGDNRLASGGCFVGRDVHSNPMKDQDGAETPEHLNAVGQWLAENVFHNQDGAGGVDGHDTRGLWCTNCHTQLGQELWRVEDCNNLIDGDCVNNIRAATLQGIADEVAGGDLNQVIAWLDPNSQDLHNTGFGDLTHTIWDPSVSDALLATIEVSTTGPGACAPLTGVFNPTFGVDVCVSLDDDGDPSVNILSFCTTDDCVSRINNNKTDQSQWRYPANPFQGTGTVAAAVPFDAATDGRDHWLAAGEPHCADCHAAPYVEQSGNNHPFPPFNYPAKASLMRYSRGHRDISCQGCHESIHGLYPVTPTIDSTTYAQAAALNHDGSHGPLKCGTCHQVDGNGIPTWIDDLEYEGQQIGSNFDRAVSWAHTFTDEADLRNGACRNCHGDEWNEISDRDEEWLKHTDKGRVSRKMMDQAEVERLGHVSGDPAVSNPFTTVCRGCHGDARDDVSCNDSDWREHLTRGRVAEKVWEYVSEAETGSTCGW